MFGKIGVVPGIGQAPPSTKSAWVSIITSADLPKSGAICASSPLIHVATHGSFHPHRVTLVALARATTLGASNPQAERIQRRGFPDGIHPSPGGRFWPSLTNGLAAKYPKRSRVDIASIGQTSSPAVGRCVVSRSEAS